MANPWDDLPIVQAESPAAQKEPAPSKNPWDDLPLVESEEAYSEEPNRNSIYYNDGKGRSVLTLDASKTGEERYADRPLRYSGPDMKKDLVVGSFYKRGPKSPIPLSVSDEEYERLTRTPSQEKDYGYGSRTDGTPKGLGYFGELKRPDGQVSTELSIGVGFDDGEREIPALVPTLSRDEVDYLLNGGKPTPEIVRKAVDHAKLRMSQGKSPYAQEGEQVAPQTPQVIQQGDKFGLAIAPPPPTDLSKNYYQELSPVAAPVDYGLTGKKALPTSMFQLYPEAVGEAASNVGKTASSILTKSLSGIGGIQRWAVENPVKATVTALGDTPTAKAGGFLAEKAIGALTGKSPEEIQGIGANVGKDLSEISNLATQDLLGSRGEEINRKAIVTDPKTGSWSFNREAIKSPEWWANAIVEGAGEFAKIAMIARATKSPQLVAATLSADTFGNIYNESRDKGDSKEKATTKGMLSGAIMGILTELPLAKVIGRDQFRTPIMRALGSIINIEATMPASTFADRFIQNFGDKGLSKEELMKVWFDASEQAIETWKNPTTHIMSLLGGGHAAQGGKLPPKITQEQIRQSQLDAQAQQGLDRYTKAERSKTEQAEKFKAQDAAEEAAYQEAMQRESERKAALQEAPPPVRAEGESAEPAIRELAAENQQALDEAKTLEQSAEAGEEVRRKIFEQQNLDRKQAQEQVNKFNAKYGEKPVVKQATEPAETSAVPAEKKAIKSLQELDAEKLRRIEEADRQRALDVEAEQRERTTANEEAANRQIETEQIEAPKEALATDAQKNLENALSSIVQQQADDGRKTAKAGVGTKKSSPQEINKVTIDILNRTPLKGGDVVDYVSSSMADGEKLRIEAEAVLRGEKSIDEAAKVINDDITEKHLPSKATEVNQSFKRQGSRLTPKQPDKVKQGQAPSAGATKVPSAELERAETAQPKPISKEGATLSYEQKLEIKKDIDNRHARLVKEEMADREFFGEDSPEAKASAQRTKDFEMDHAGWTGVMSVDEGGAVRGRFEGQEKPPKGYVLENGKYVYKPSGEAKKSLAKKEGATPSEKTKLQEMQDKLSGKAKEPPKTAREQPKEAPKSAEQAKTPPQRFVVRKEPTNADKYAYEIFDGTSKEPITSGTKDVIERLAERLNKANPSANELREVQESGKAHLDPTLYDKMLSQREKGSGDSEKRLAVRKDLQDEADAAKKNSKEPEGYKAPDVPEGGRSEVVANPEGKSATDRAFDAMEAERSKLTPDQEKSAQDTVNALRVAENKIKEAGAENDIAIEFIDRPDKLDINDPKTREELKAHGIDPDSITGDIYVPAYTITDSRGRAVIRVFFHPSDSRGVRAHEVYEEVGHALTRGAFELSGKAERRGAKGLTKAADEAIAKQVADYYTEGKRDDTLTRRTGETAEDIHKRVETKLANGETVNVLDVQARPDNGSLNPSGDTTRLSIRTLPKTKDTLFKSFKKGEITKEQYDRYLKDLDSVARAVHANLGLLDYIASDEFSALKANSDPAYTKSLDFTTMCVRRYVLQSTIDQIQMDLGRVLRADEFTKIRQMLQDKGVIVSCGACYVDSRRAYTATVIGKALNGYVMFKNSIKVLDSNGDMVFQGRRRGKGNSWEQYKKDNNITSDDGYLIETVTKRIKIPPLFDKADTKGRNLFLTMKGITEDLPRLYPEKYKMFRRMFAGTQIKIPEARTEYRQEILKLKPEMIETMNRASGLRWQSWSDFELPHLLDAMQAVADMSLKGLKGQAYTKQLQFVRAMARTRMAINMSLIPKGNGFDANGKLLFDQAQSFPFKDGLYWRDKYNNVGFEAIGVSDAHIKALLADPRIDYVIPYHASGMSGEFAKKLGMEGWNDYADTEGWRDAKTGKKTGDISKYVFPSEHRGNKELLFKLAAERGSVPPFPQFKDLDGYMKLITDRRLYDKNGNYIEQEIVRPEYNVLDLQKMMKDYKGEKAGADQEVVGKFKEENQESRRNALRAKPKEPVEAKEAIDRAITINDSSQPFTEQILSGEKTIETRDTANNALAPFVGKRVGIVRTGTGDTKVVGYATIGKPIHYTSVEQFRADEGKHLVKEGSDYDFKSEKYGYPLLDVERVGPFAPKSVGRKVAVIEPPTAPSSRYLSLAEKHKAGDKSVEPELQKMVDEKAREAGYDSGVLLYHGTRGKRFTEFKEDAARVNRQYNDSDPSFFYFTPDKAYAYGYANRGLKSRERSELKPRVLSAYLKTDNLLDITDRINNRPEGESFGDAKRAALKELTDKHDGFVFRGNEYNTPEYAVRKSSMIKSADPVTYDDAGNIIPLEKRFNPEEADIRLSVRRTEKSKEDIRPEAPLGITKESFRKQMEERAMLSLGGRDTVKDQTIIDEAMDRVKDPRYIPNLVAELAKTARPITDAEVYSLAHESVRIRAQLNDAMKDLADIKADPKNQRAINQRIALADSQLADFERYIRPSRGAVGASLRFMRELINSDYSPAGMLARQHAANSDRPATPEQRDRIAKLSQEMDRLLKELEATKAVAAQAKTAQDAHIRELIANLMSGNVIETSASLKAYAKTRAAEAMARIRKAKLRDAETRLSVRAGKATEPVKDTSLDDYAEVGAQHLINGIQEAAAWDARMLKDFGEAIRPKLTDLYVKSFEKFIEFRDAAPKAKAKAMIPDAERRDAEREKRADKQIATLERSIAEVRAGTYEAPEPKSRIEYGKRVQDKLDRIIQLKEEFDEALKRDRLNGDDWVAKMDQYLKERKVMLPESTRKDLEAKLRSASRIVDDQARNAAIMDAVNDIVVNVPIRAGEWFEAYIYSNMLSSPTSHERNILGNLTNALLTRPSTLAIGGDFAGAGKYLAKAARTMFGDAWSAAADAFKHGETGKLIEGFDNPETSTFEQAKRVQGPQNRLARLLWKANTTIPKFLNAQDVFFGRMIEAGETARLVRSGVPEATAQERAKKLSDKYLYRDPLKANVDKSLDPISKAMAELGHWMDQIRGPKVSAPVRITAKLTIPFLKTVVRIAQFSTELGPMGFIGSSRNRIATHMFEGAKYKDLQAELKAEHTKADPDITKINELEGKISEIDAISKERLGKAMLGTAFTIAGALAAAMGNTIWKAPDDPYAKKLFYDAGYVPYSVKIGNTVVPMMYLGPAMASFAIFAALRDTMFDNPRTAYENIPEKAWATAWKIPELYMSQMPLKGVANIMNQLQGTEDMTWRKTVGSTALQMVPASGFLRWVTNIVDPTYRKATTIGDTIKAAIPGLSDNVRALKDSEGLDAHKDILDVALPYKVRTINRSKEQEFKDRMSQLRETAAYKAELKKQQGE